ncbi:MAG: hypothetical protein CMH49_08665 [Myxococcales bacterium]|nr:hypothetical protein [Myxococcales bacterium]
MIAMGCAICREQKYIAHQGKQPLPRCERHPDRSMIDWSYIERYPKDKLLGEVISGKYILIRPLGKGGFGSVYFAIQKQSDSNNSIRKAVAIKFLTRISEEHIELFNDEMRLMSHLRNQYIVQLFTSGQHKSHSAGQNIPYMVMEFVEGETLSDRLIRQGALSPSQVILLIKQLLSALIEAHDKGIIHRDLKPLNLMICPDPDDDFRLVVLDFGISKMVDDATREATRNKIMGTPYYLAPEILLKGELNYHTDLFAVAVIAYESLSYHSPFLNEELSGIEPYLRLRSIYKDQKKPDPLPAHLPQEWTLFFECALHSDPQQRFPNAKSMIIAIEALELRTTDVHQQMEKESTIFGHFEDDDETMLFKKQLMSMSEEHHLESKKTNSPYSEPINQSHSELSILESVDMIDPVEVLTVKMSSLSSPDSEDAPKEKSISRSGLESVHEVSVPKLPPPKLPPPIPIEKVGLQLKPPPLPKEVMQSVTKPHSVMTEEPKPHAMIKPPSFVIRSPALDKLETTEEQQIPQAYQASSSPTTQLPKAPSTGENVLSISSPNVLTIQVGEASPLLGQIADQATSKMTKIKKERKVHQSLRLLGQSQTRLHKHTYTSSREQIQHQQVPKRMGSFIWLQLLIMVGLGIGFAYVVAHYILN